MDKSESLRPTLFESRRRRGACQRHFGFGFSGEIWAMERSHRTLVSTRGAIRASWGIWDHGDKRRADIARGGRMVAPGSLGTPAKWVYLEN